MHETQSRTGPERQWRILGNWEPKMFLKRRGEGAHFDVDAFWAESHSDAAIRRMKEMGINLAHIHFHKGYGLEVERESIAEAAAWAKKLHAHGIRVGVYVGCTFFDEVYRHPDLPEMLARGASEWSFGAQYFRRRWCYNSPKSFEYFQKVLQVAVNEVKADVIHFDHAFCFRHDQLCHCKYCMAGFAEFVRQEIPGIIAAAGYERAEQLLPPPPGNEEYLASVQEISEPGDIAWVLYHAQAGRRALQRYAAYARSLSPDVSIFYNGSNLCGITTYSCPRMEMEPFNDVELACVEDSIDNPVRTTDDGMPVSRFRPYKRGSRTRTGVCYYTTIRGENTPLMLVEAAAFNYGCLGFVETVMHEEFRMTAPEDRAFLEFLVANESLFLNRRPWHHVAVLRHHESMLLNPFPSGLSPYVVEQMLFERHVPFALIDNSELQSERLRAEFDLVILPDTKCLSDSEIGQLEAFVAAGGRLLSTGNTGRATTLNQFRPAWGLSQIFSRQIAPDKSEGLQRDKAGGAARAIHLPELAFDLPERSTAPRFGKYPWYTHRYWNPPKNAETFAQSVEELLGADWRVRTDLPRTAGMECYRTASGYRFCLVNYRHPEPVGESTLLLNRRALAVASPRFHWKTPEGERTLNVITEGGTLRIPLPAFSLLAVLSVSGSERNQA